MNNNYNAQGQFGGWGPYQQGNYNSDYYNELYKKQQEKENDKKTLKKMGNWFGIAIVLFTVLAAVTSVVILLLNEFFPKVSIIYENINATMAYEIFASILFIATPFLIAHGVLKKNKITGILPLGTTYNGKAAIGLTMLFIPLMIFSSFGINIVSSIFQESVGITFYSGMEDMKYEGVVGVLIATLSMAVLPAIVEEVIIRGIVMQPLRRFGDAFAIVSSAVIFSLMHGNMVQIPYTVVAGIFMGYLTIATGSLWPSIILHFVNNFYSVVVVAFSDNISELAGNVAMFVAFGLFIVSGIIGGIIYFPMNYKVKLNKGVNSLTTGEKIVTLFVNPAMIIAIIILLIQTLTMIEF